MRRAGYPGVRARLRVEPAVLRDVPDGLNRAECVRLADANERPGQVFPLVDLEGVEESPDPLGPERGPATAPEVPALATTGPERGGTSIVPEWR